MEEIHLPLPKAISHSIEHNEHRVYYQSIADFVEDMDLSLTHEDLKACIQTDEIWVLYWYPYTPVGHCRVAGPTLDRVLELAGVR